MGDDYEETNEELMNKVQELQESINNGSFQTCQVSAWDDDIVGIEDSRNPKDEIKRQILEAAEHNDLELVKSLLDKDITLLNVVDKDGYSPLHRACYNGHTEVVETLIEYGADIHKRTIDGWTPLHSACKWNNTECVNVLVNYGADVNALTKGDLTPLHLAASHSYSRDILIMLLYHPDIDPYKKSKSNETAREIATRSGQNYDVFEAIDPCFNNLTEDDD